MALHFYSPNAYRYIRNIFNNNIPAPVTMRVWYRSVDGEPGITDEALCILNRKAKEYEDAKKVLLISLISDEMAIKKAVIWNRHQQKFDGVVTCQNSENANNNNTLPTAKDVLVFMAVGDDFKIPVAYFLLSGLHSYGRASLTQLVINKINETGARVISLTSDGLRANIAVAKQLGADFENNKPYFHNTKNPADKIYFILDPPHMIKLARGCFGTHQLYHDNEPLDWSLIVALHEMQKEKNFNLGNQLSDMHLNFHLKPMNVRLACETMSNSVADCLQQLNEDNYPKFQNCGKTIEFIRLINNVFDVSNTKPKTNDRAFKQAIYPLTAQEFFQYFNRAKDYIRGIEINEWNSKKTVLRRKLVLRSKSFTPFFGMIHNLTAFEGLYNDLVVNGHLDALNTFRFSQDHLETWFSSVRRGLGGYSDI